MSLAAMTACGSWKRVGATDPTRTAPEHMPEVFDPSLTYRAMGLLPDAGMLGFVGVARVIAGPRPDSMVIMIALSLKNRGFTFRRDGDQFVAEYHAEIAVRRGGGSIAAQASRDERIRVASFRETQRNDESVIFQQFLTVVPGEYVISVNVRDRNSPNSGGVETPVSVPALRPVAISLPVAVYQAASRTSLDHAPDLVMNPRQTIEYGVDSLHFYLETYGVAAGAQLLLSVVDAAGQIAWRDSIRVDSLRPVHGYRVSVPPGPLSIGRYDLRLEQQGTVMAAAPFLVSFSDQYAAANLEDIVSLLRYFAPTDSLRKVLAAPPAERGAAWQRFWHATDPNPATPENEAIEDYLRRVQGANEHFHDEGGAGWLTERGEVYITLGEPSEVLDRRPDMNNPRGRYIQWSYYDYRLTLTFIDDGGFGRYRLDSRSRADFMRVANRVRGW